MVRVFLSVVSLILLAATAGAQVPTGTISGRVLSTDEAPLPGATVTATSPSLQGDRTVVTSVNGDFVIPLLPPGDYTVVIRARRFSVAQAADRCGRHANDHAQRNDGGQRRRRDHQRRRQRRAVRRDRDGRGEVPSGTDGDAAVESLARCLDPDGAGACMPPAPIGATYSIAGAMSYRKPLCRERRGDHREPARPAVHAVHRGCAAGDDRRHLGRLRRVRPLRRRLVNAITKSGGNTFSGSYRQSFNNDNWRATTPFNEAKLDQASCRPTSTPSAVRSPVDQLWFFTAGRFQEQQSSFNTAATSIPYIRTNDEKRYEGKLHLLADVGTTVPWLLQQDQSAGRPTSRPGTSWTCGACTTRASRRICCRCTTPACSRPTSRSRVNGRSATSPSLARAHRPGI